MPGGTTPRVGACCVKPPWAPKETERTAQGEGNPVQGQREDWRRLGAERDPHTSATAPGGRGVLGWGRGEKRGRAAIAQEQPWAPCSLGTTSEPQKVGSAGPRRAFSILRSPCQSHINPGRGAGVFCPTAQMGKLRREEILLHGYVGRRRQDQRRNLVYRLTGSGCRGRDQGSEDAEERAWQAQVWMAESARL